MAKASTDGWRSQNKCNWWLWRCENNVVLASVRDTFLELGKPTGNKGCAAFIDPAKTQFYKEGIVLYKSVACNWSALWAFVKRHFVRFLVS